MSQNNIERRQCPTRIDGADTLIAHWITEGTCCERQQRHYHKCFGCSFHKEQGIGKGLATTSLAPLPKPAKREEKPAPAAAAAV